jgi:membrane fusion protein, heavy metal efflux system
VAEQKEADVVIAKVEKRPMTKEVTAPGEVTLDIYRSVEVTPRIEAQVVK